MICKTPGCEGTCFKKGYNQALVDVEKIIRHLSDGNVITISQSFKIIKKLKDMKR